MMNVISFSNSKFNKLNLLDLDKSVFNTEAQIYNYSYKNNAKVLKKLYRKWCICKQTLYSREIR